MESHPGPSASGRAGGHPPGVAVKLRVRVHASRLAIGEAVAIAILDLTGLPVINDSTDPTQAHRARRRPDVVIVIGSTFDGSTSAAVRIARRRWPQSIVIALCDTNRVADGVALVRQGADTWLYASEGIDVLRSLLIRIRTGDRVLLRPDAYTYVAASLSHAPPDQSETRPPLTSRERQVLDCFAQGLSRPDIALTLGISPATLRTHVQNILRKLDVHSIDRAAALVVPTNTEVAIPSNAAETLDG